MVRTVALFSLVSLVACGSSAEPPIPLHDGGPPFATDAAPVGKNDAAVAFCPPLTPGCQVQTASDGGPAPSLDGGSSNDSSMTGPPTLFGTWVAGTAAESFWLTLNADGTYAFAILIPTSTVTNDVFIQEGTYAVSGVYLVLTPTEQTCPSASPPAPSVSTYFFDGEYLITYDSTGKQSIFAHSATAPDLTGSSDGGASTVLGCPETPFAAYPLTGTAPVPTSPGVIPAPYGSWVVANSENTLFVQVLLNSDGSYEIALLIVTSTVSADEYIQKGTFTINGPALVFTPTEASCPGNVPVFSNNYYFDQDVLVLQDPSGKSTGFVTDPTLMLGQGLNIVLGCSVDNGPWTPYALAPIQN